MTRGSSFDEFPALFNQMVNCRDKSIDPIIFRKNPNAATVEKGVFIFLVYDWSATNLVGQGRGEFRL